jgi:hypothetical protein
LTHPVPSRSQFTSTYRRVLNTVETENKDLNKVLDKYFFDHPELVPLDTIGTEKNQSNEYYKAYYLNHDQAQRQLEPLYAEYTAKLESANRFASTVGLVSPAVAFHQSLVLMAGHSSRQYQYFTQKIMDWRKPYFAYLLKSVLANQWVNSAEARRYEPFTYVPYRYALVIYCNLLVLLLLDVILLLSTGLLLRRRTLNL